MKELTQALIDEHLNNALKNGYAEILDWEAIEICDDITTYAAELEQVDSTELRLLVLDWLRRQRAARASLQERSGKLLDTAQQTLTAMRALVIAIMRLRRLDDESPMPGYIALQDGAELDAAMKEVAGALKLLEKDLDV